MSIKGDRDGILKEAFSYHHALVTYAFALLRDHALAEDAVQNAYVALTRRHETITGSSVLAWCRGTVRLEVLRILRKTGRELSTGDSFLFDSISDSMEIVQTPEHEMMRLEQLERLRTCFERLPARSQQLVGRRYLDGLGPKALAKRMKMSEAAVRKSIYRIRLLLRECIQREPISAP
jgi:RNA polymerase sigma-70 factor (ECF subfamily)